MGQQRDDPTGPFDDKRSPQAEPDRGADRSEGEQRTFEPRSRLASQEAVTNTGRDPHLGAGGDPAEGKRDEDDDVDAATG